MRKPGDNPAARRGHFHSRTGGSALRIVALASGVILILLLLHFGMATRSGIWYQTFYNTVHVPLFGIVGIGVFALAGYRWQDDIRRQVVATALAVIALAVASEFAQIATARNASTLDLLIDVLAASSFVMLAMAASKSIGLGRRERRRLGLAGAVLLLVLLSPLIVVSAACLDRNHRFPVLISFETPFDRLFARPRNAELTRVRNDNASGGHSARVRLRDGRWPGVAFGDLWPDWSGYGTLVADLMVIDDQPLIMNIRIHDRMHNNRFDDRYNRQFRLEPGPNQLRIPIADIEAAPATRTMDIEEISNLVIFSDPGNAGRLFEIDEIRIE